ncbi:hypothetical protein, partial [Priestia megaterium]
FQGGAKPWTPSTPAKGKLLWNGFYKHPQPPQNFEGAPSPVGVKQTWLFECQEGSGVETLSIP